MFDSSSVSFPASPVNGQTYEYGGTAWQYNGAAWVQIAHPSLVGKQRMDIAKAWLHSIVNASGVPAINASYNVASITDTGVGQLTITFSTPFNSVNWAASMCASRGTGSAFLDINEFESGRTASSLELLSVKAVDATTLFDPGWWGFQGFGDQ